MDINEERYRLANEKHWIDLPTCKISKFAQRTPEWHLLRKYRVSASTAASCCDMSKWRNSNSMIYDMIYGSKDLSDNPHIQRGVRLEPSVRQWYCETFNCRAEEVGIAIHKGNQYLGASCDAIVLDNDGKPSNVCVEIKCPERIKPEIENKNLSLPERFSYDYYMQMILQMYVTDCKFCDFVVYSELENKIFAERVPFDQDFWDKVMHPRLLYYIENLLKPTLKRIGQEPIMFD